LPLEDLTFHLEHHKLGGIPNMLEDEVKAILIRRLKGVKVETRMLLQTIPLFPT
jgi:hypothetical protein